MNLALGFLIIFIIAIPGIVFRITYLSSPYSKRNINTTAIDEIFNSLIPAFIFHSIFILILQAKGYQVDFQYIFNLLIGNNTAKNIDELNGYLGGFLIYMLLITAVNFFSALLLRGLVLKFRWYKTFPSLGIYNKWYYKLKPTAEKEEKISVWLDVLVETRNETLLYRGFLTDFWLDKEGGIKELHMEDVRRRVLSKDVQAVHEAVNEDELAEQVDERYYYIPGELFIIEDVKNMNITYFEEEIAGG